MDTFRQKPKPFFLIPLALLALGSCLLGRDAQAETGLPPRPFMGVAPAPPAEGAEPGSPPPAVLGQVLPGGTGAALGLQSGDRIYAVNGELIDDFQDLVQTIGGLEVGQDITVTVFRGEADPFQLTGPLQGRPRETSEAYEVIYGVVDSGPNRLRSIVYRPPGATAETPQPVVYYIQGYTCSSVDYAAVPELTMHQILVTLAEAGYVVYKQEKPGVGDSQGENCADIDFESELAGFRDGLKTLRELPFVDAEQVHIFGHSLGGIQGPLLATEQSVASIMVYGAGIKSWRDYMLDLFGKQALLYGTSEEEALANRDTIQPLIDAWLTTDRSWDDIMADPELQAGIESGLLPIQGDRVFGRNYRFFRGLNRYDLAEAWASIDSHALAMHGSLDIQAIDSSWTDALVEAASTGGGRIAEAVILEGAEHGFVVYDSREELMAAMADGSHSAINPGKRYDERAAQVMLEWLERMGQ
ncbi:alpha/beta fold hydrolase [Wenzhouxiangella marina]|uniref:Uncharacterized protein n=1 Tax=Wenzhouxiangella marina TaxID=1579979 RepID=A0A0K0XZX1_9GAMM|nr:alpha/beta fold hydrolase [Wenzhouxiangella marina]AKS43233.1 hypothetical protein WM2015_2876 [Wenzhouxiangella marina]MBB6087080.1 hypothetical protein [Wenzhouxiangella marina]